MPTADAISRASKSTTHEHDALYHLYDPKEPFSAPLLAWYDAQSGDRKMPWRREVTQGERKAMTAEQRTQRAYEVWVSETMCQQTQVATVIPYYEKWLKRYPTVAVLAKADVEDVRGLWSGLGYYSRATRLLAGAQKIVDDFDGVIPEDPKTLDKDVPGIGPYTAAAICSIAFGTPVAAVDGNVQRVVSRVFALHAPIAAKATLNAIADLAQTVVSTERPGEHNQAIMDLGYSVCTPRNPKCTACPLSSRCLALAEVTALKRSKTSSFFGTSRDIEDAAVRASPNGKGKGKACTLCTPFDPSSCLGPSGDGVAHYPAKKVRKAVPEEETAVRIVEVVAGSEGVDDRRVLVVQRPEKGLLAGQWEFPAIDLPPGEESTPASRGMAIGKRLGALFGREAAAAMSGDGKVTERPIVRHVFSHQIRHYIPDAVLSATAAPAKPKDGRAKWMKRSEVDGLHLGKAMRLVWADHVAGEVRTTGKKATAKRKVVAVAPKKAKPKRKAESEDDDGFVVDDDVEVEVERKPRSKRKPSLAQPGSSPVRKLAEADSPPSTKRKRVILVSDEVRSTKLAMRRQLTARKDE